MDIQKDVATCVSAAAKGDLVSLAQTDDKYVTAIDSALREHGMNLVWRGSGANDGGKDYNSYAVNVWE